MHEARRVERMLGFGRNIGYQDNRNIWLVIIDNHSILLVTTDNSNI